MSAPVPDLFIKLRSGDESALNALLPLLYDELHRIAARHLRGERSNHTLQPTALVHEAYLKLFAGQELKVTNEAHFLAIASRAMRQVLVDYARSRATKKRSGEDGKLSFTTSLEVEDEDRVELLDLIELDGALQALPTEDQALAKLIEMRYFCGMTAEEIAEAIGASVHVVRHDMRYGQAWLRRKLTQ